MRYLIVALVLALADPAWAGKVICVDENHDGILYCCETLSENNHRYFRAAEDSDNPPLVVEVPDMNKDGRVDSSDKEILDAIIKMWFRNEIIYTKLENER